MTSNTSSTIQVEKQDIVTRPVFSSPTGAKSDGSPDLSKSAGDGSQKSVSNSGVIKGTADQSSFNPVVQVS